MAKLRSHKSTTEPRISDRHVRKVLVEAGARLPSCRLARVMGAIMNDKPIPPPDAKGWDAAALLITASVLVTRAAAMMGTAEARSAASRARRVRKKGAAGPRQS